MSDLWEDYPVDEDYDSDESFLSPLAKHTDIGWRHILQLCKRRASFGFGALDSFLSGPDLGKRIELVEKEAVTNEWLRLELSDTLSLNQESDWSSEQTQRLRRAAKLTAE